jgi:hypothetical protein
MATTPQYGFEYPTRSDPPSGHTSFERLAQRVETEIYRMDQMPDRQIFTSNGTWTKPTGAKWVRVQVQAGGGGGGGGAANSQSQSARSGEQGGLGLVVVTSFF